MKFSTTFGLSVVAGLALILSGVSLFVIAHPTAQAHSAYTPQSRTLYMMVMPDMVGQGYDRFEPQLVAVHRGDDVTIVIQSNDPMPHGFMVEGYGVNQNIPAATTDKSGAVTQMAEIRLHLTATKAGLFRIYCTVPCGPGHSEMQGTLLVEES